MYSNNKERVRTLVGMNRKCLRCYLGAMWAGRDRLARIQDCVTIDVAWHARRRPGAGETRDKPSTYVVASVNLRAQNSTKILKILKIRVPSVHVNLSGVTYILTCVYYFICRLSVLSPNYFCTFAPRTSRVHAFAASVRRRTKANEEEKQN